MANISNSALAQAIADLVSYWTDFAQEYKNWLGGTTNGGPNSDGEYPLTDWEGDETLVKSPAKLQDDVTGIADSATTQANAAAASADLCAIYNSACSNSATTATTQAIDADTFRIAAAASADDAASSAVVATAQAAIATAAAGGVTGAPPVWATTPSVSWVKGATVSYDLRNHVEDPDSTTITFANVGAELPEGISLNADGIMSGIPTTAEVTQGIIVEAYDGITAVPTTFTITVSDSPVWLSTPDPNFVKGTAATYDLSNLVSGSPPIAITLNTGGGVNNVTNECLQSEDFTTTWSLGNGAITSDHVAGNFDGGIGEDYDRLQATGVGGAAQVYARQLLTLTVDTQYVFGVHAKADNNDWLCIETGTWSGGKNLSQYFNLNTGAAGADAGFDAYGITDLGGGEYFCWVAMTVGPSDSTGWLYLMVADSDGDKVVSLNGTSSILLGGAQVYEGATDNGAYVGPTTTIPVTENIGGGGGGASLPPGVTYVDPILTFDGRATSNTETGLIATATDNNSQVQDSASFPVDMAAAPASGSQPIFGRNGWFMTGNYTISNSAIQLVQEPWLTWNAEKDILIPQMFGFYSNQLDKFTGFWKNVKAINPDCKILPYISPSEVAKVSNGVSGPSWQLDAVQRGEEADWFLRDASGNLVEAAFSASLGRMNYAIQFNTNNSGGRNYGEEHALQSYNQVSLVTANGAFKDYIDGFYFDVCPPSAQKVYVWGSNPRVSSPQDFDQDASADGQSDETDGLGVEANYGGARMHRRGAVELLAAYEAQYNIDIQGMPLVVFRNSTRDGLDYSNALGDAHAMSLSEFYQRWGGGIFEDAQRSLCHARSGTEYPYQGWNGWNQQCRFAQRIKQANKPAASHPWGKFGEHAVIVECAMINRTPTQADYEMARYYEFFARINGMASGMDQGKLYSFPMLDESVPYVGDTWDGNPPTSGTISPTTPNNGTDADFTLRSPDYESGGADFYWQMYELDGVRYLWVGRTDEGSLSSGEAHGTGSVATCLLPDYGAGNSGWTHLDATDNAYANPHTGKGFRNQSPSINDGSAVDAGGTYGALDLLPFHARLLVSTT